ncbi:MAG TPA: class I SAM-dependent methyltransferase [Herpetosiphonaceae bacterium]
MSDSTKRFSSRVEDYIKYRPTYPEAVIDLLKAECRLTSSSIVADIGSGTGILAELFLKHGNRVFGVEPNAEMRAAGERLLQGYPRFTSVAATAEATTLADRSVDFVAAGQAFHWFDRDRFRAECQRMLRPDGWIVLIWNDRRTDSTPFLQSYERLLLTYGTDYTTVDHKRIDHDVLAAFFAAGRFQQARFENTQVFDFAGVQGRLLSSSYTPDADHPSYQPMLAELRVIFEAHQVNRQVAFEYDTLVYYGQLS